MSEPALVAEHLGIRFGGLQALSDFSIQVEIGDIQGLIGPNGAGKTTLFNLLTGVYTPTTGQVRVSGVDVRGRRPHQITRLGLARTFQNIRLFRRLSVIDNVKVARLSELARPLFRRRGRWFDAWNNYYDWWRALLLTPGYLAEEHEIERSAEALLDVMGLLHRKDEPADSLPYGEQRRLEIARALATRPRVLLLDEPAAGMNTREKAELMQLIHQLRERFTLGILLIEHDMKLVMGICERITVLDHGETIAVGAPAEIQRDRRVIEAYLGDAFLASREDTASREAIPPTSDEVKS